MTAKKGQSLSEAKKVLRFFSRKKGDTHQLPPQVTPTLETPLGVSITMYVKFCDLTVKCSVSSTD